MSEIDEKCLTCRFFRPLDKHSARGTCVCHPPIGGSFQTVEIDQWCGQWQKNPKFHKCGGCKETFHELDLFILRIDAYHNINPIMCDACRKSFQGYIKSRSYPMDKDKQRQEWCKQFFGDQEPYGPDSFDNQPPMHLANQRHQPE